MITELINLDKSETIELLQSCDTYLHLRMSGGGGPSRIPNMVNTRLRLAELAVTRPLIGQYSGGPETQGLP